MNKHVHVHVYVSLTKKMDFKIPFSSRFVRENWKSSGRGDIGKNNNMETHAKKIKKMARLVKT